ncbi:hypothetical protein [Leptobacterium sp. I13]|uniref:hypothetical protein n=1 Tax=Leptobacterium meishanense TaxID=3128904 RepID=UPI0030EDB8C6
MISEFWDRVIIDVVLLGIVSVILGKWVNYKFEKKLKDHEPLTAEQVLRRENYLNSKREVFFEVIILISRNLASTKWSGPGAPEKRIPYMDTPNEVEINSCYAKLNLYVDDNKILKKYPFFFSGKPTPVDIAEYIGLLRKDLGYGDSIITSNEYNYIFNSR